jgi:hypothetical protein
VLRLLLALFALVVVVGACAPARAPSDEVPSLEQTCAHVAEVESRAGKGAVAELSKSCEKWMREYRDDGEAARWPCRALCLSSASDLAQINTCSTSCAVRRARLACNEVFYPEDVADAFGAAAARERLIGSPERLTADGDRDHCFTNVRFRIASSREVQTVALWAHVEETSAAAQRRTTPASGCHAAVAKGRVTLSADIYDEKACNIPALQHVLARGAARIDATAATLARDTKAPAAPAHTRSPTRPVVRPPPSCPNQPDVQPPFAPMPAPVGAVPTLAAMCTNVAQQESLGAPPHVWPPGTTMASAQKECEERWRGFRDEEGAARWACEAQCRGSAKSYAQLERCDHACAPVVSPFTCGCVVRESDVSDGLGANASLIDAKDEQVSPSHQECTAHFAIEGVVDPMHVSLYLHGTRAETKRQENGVGVLTPCQVAAARGHVFVIVDGPVGVACDKPALQRVLDLVSRRLSPD